MVYNVRMMSKEPSPREKLQNELFDWLEMRSRSKFTAPYGVLAGLEPVNARDRRPGGKVRTITFGVARYLDATIKIYSEKDMRVQAQGAMSRDLNGRKFTSKEELMAVLETL